MVLFNESIGKENRVFRKIENMEEINRKTEKICERCGKNDNNVIKLERKEYLWYNFYGLRKNQFENIITLKVLGTVSYLEFNKNKNGKK